MLRRFFSYYRPYKALFALDIVSAVLDASFTLCIPFIVRDMLKYDLGARDLTGLAARMGTLVVLVALMSVTTYINTRWGHNLGTRIETDMRSDLFRHLQKLSFSYFDNTKTGHLISRISNDLNNISELAHHGPEELLISLCMIIGAFGVMFWFSAPLALVTLAPLPLVVVWSVVIGRRMTQGFRDARERVADINASVENSIQGIREVQSFGNEEIEICKFQGVNREFMLAKNRMYKGLGTFFSGMTFLLETYPLVVIGGGVLFARAGRIDLADLIGFLLYLRFLMNPIRRLAWFVEQFQQGATSFERFVEVMDVEPEIVDRPGAVAPEEVRGEIELRDVWFRYKTSESWVLEGVTLKIPAGATAALVGESGAGKSTIAALIPRFYEAQKGEITIDGRNVLDLKTRWLRSSIGIVQQNVFLFDATIRENIMFGNPEATEEALIEAARRANILDFIRALPQGFDSMVGERGVKLSGGQKQRVSIARVFLKDPPILIFDEATSSLDTESESLIRQAMLELSRGRTTLIIAHRLSTVRRADYTFVMRGGVLVEQGTHDELLARGGYYGELYASASF